MPRSNPLIDDRFIDFLLYTWLKSDQLCALEPFADHSRETFDLFIGEVRRFARGPLVASYRPMDRQPPELIHGRITAHPMMHDLWTRMVDLGLLTAPRPLQVGGAHLPLVIHTAASAYAMAANLSAYGYIGLTMGAAHLIEAFGSRQLKETFMTPMYEGRWAGTMALTEPQAGSSLADIRTKARPNGDHYRLRGSKVFISGGDHDLTENIVHLVLARIDGAPDGSSGVSLFAVPRLRPEGEGWTENDVEVSGLIHKIGWRGLPSVALEFGTHDDCHAWLVGEPHRGLSYMFQMMNEARIMVGINSAASASVAYHEARDYALERRQGRRINQPTHEPVAIVEHADVRRMLLRQKAIIWGSFALVTRTAHCADLAAHAHHPDQRKKAEQLLDILTPIAKTFPAERGFEANTLALQIHGGYGYSSEFPVEAYLRDQKLNSLHEGTSGIQSLDLLGRKVLRDQGVNLAVLLETIAETIKSARTHPKEFTHWADDLERATETVFKTSTHLGTLAADGRVEDALARSWDYLEMLSNLVLAWQWVDMSLAAVAPNEPMAPPLMNGLRTTAAYWMSYELPAIHLSAARCTSDDRTYLDVQPEWL